MTAEYLLWRACERFGMAPWLAGVIDELDPETARRILAYEQVRQIEEQRERAAMGRSLRR